MTQPSTTRAPVLGALVGPAPVIAADLVLLLLRLVLALVFLAHGWAALAGDGIAAVVQAQRDTGIPLPDLAGPATVYLELAGAPLLALGALTRLVATALSGLMVGALVFVHLPYGIFVENGGFELVLVLAAACAVLAVAGPGRLGADFLMAGRPDPAKRPRPAAVAGE